MASIYKDLLHEIIKKCSRFKKKELSISEIHGFIHTAESQVVSYEEKDLRQLLCFAENDIDYIRTMNNEADFMYKPNYQEFDSYNDLLPIINRIEMECRKRLD